MKISGKNNNFDNQRIGKDKFPKSELKYEEKDIANSPNPAEFLGRSQVMFKGTVVKGVNKGVNADGKSINKPIKLIETPVLSKEDCIKSLKDLEFLDSDIEKLDFNNNDLISGISYIKAYLGSGLFDENAKNEIKEYLRGLDINEKDECIKEFNGIGKYANKKTLEQIKNYIEIENDDDFGDFLSFLNEADEPKSFLEKLPVMTTVTGKLKANSLRNYKRLSKEYFDAITPERLEIINQINEYLPKEGKLTTGACIDIKEQENDITPDLINKYCEEIQDLSKYDAISKESLKYSYAGDDIKTMTEKMGQVIKVLKDYPMNLTSTDKKSLAFSNFYDLTKRKDFSDIQGYINSLSDDAKIKGILHLPDEESDFPKDKMAEICNLVFDKDFGPVKEEALFKFIESDKENNYENLDGIIKLIGVHKGTAHLDTNYPERTLYVANGDYGGAAEAIKLKNDIYNKNLCFNYNDFGKMFEDKDADFTEYNKVLTYIRDNDINYYDYPSDIYTSKNGANKLELRYYVKCNNYWLYDESLKALDRIAENIETDEEKDFVKEYLLFKGVNGLLFSVNDVEKLLQSYKDRTESTKEVLDIYKKEDRLKYSANTDSICDTAKALDIDKSYTKLIMDLKNCFRDRRRFYDGKDIILVVEAAQIDKNLVNELLSQKVVYDVSGNETTFTDKKMLEDLNQGIIPEYEKDDRHVNFKFGADSIKDIVELCSTDKELTLHLLDKYKNEKFYADDLKFIIEAAQTDKDFVMSLIDATEKESKDKEKQRFSILGIKNIIENAPDNKQFVIDMMNKTTTDSYYKIERPKYNCEDLINLCKAAKINEAKTRELINIKAMSYGTEYNWLNPYQIKQLLEKYPIDNEIFDRLITKKEKQYNDDIVPSYYSDNIITIMSATEKNKNLVKTLLDTNDTVNTEFYSASGISSIIDTYEKAPEYTTYLLSLKSKHKNGKEYPLIKDYNISKIVNAHIMDPEYTDKLVNIISTDYNGNPAMVYDGGDIELILQAKEIDKDYTEKLLAQRVEGYNSIVKRFDGEVILKIVKAVQKDRDLINYIVNQKTVQDDGKETYTYKPGEILYFIENSENIDRNYLKYLSDMRVEISGKIVPQFKMKEMLEIVQNTTFDDFRNLENKIGKKIAFYNKNDIYVGTKFLNIIGKQGINEIPIKDKKDLLRNIVAANINLFSTSDVLKEDFPLLPVNKEKYCELLPALVRSLGLEINPLSAKQISDFDNSSKVLSDKLAKLSDTEFNKLEIDQEYNKNEFVKDILDEVKGINKDELQKIFDYYGFELVENERSKNGYSIIGYPVNLNNGKKLAEITDENTKKIVEKIRPKVIKFSENNKIISNNKEIEKELNDIVKVLPEIKTMIGKKQHQTHDFDVFKHSLKVMQKITQDKNFQTLNESDKKIMLLASLMHDITKREGYSDGTHAKESSYDTYFIAKKFKLSKQEEIKLYTLIKHHEWLAYVNTATNAAERKKCQESIAFDLQQNNLFDLALMFTHADLKAVKKSDIFHDKKEGNSRIDFNREVRSFGEAADFHAEKIKEYVRELQKTQPILPVTKMPSTDDIEKVITRVNKDGSTNIKGVYKDIDGLIVIKFNEVEDEGWEMMGLPKGSSTKGVIAKCTEKDEFGNDKEYDVETGNIKFFVHGLDYSNQLAKFDAFALPDSDALLSVSYAERPETKYRFFRPQGVMLDVPTEYVYGGGETDSGSGCGKDIQNFKNNYVFGGCRERDRVYVSNLVKEATGMNDEEYIEFLKKNKDKSMIEIEPKDIRETLIKKYATINSNTRFGSRAYNEMYVSNPDKVMGVFAYEMNDDEKRDNPLEFLKNIDERTSFLKDYAKEHKIPFYVFGD